MRHGCAFCDYEGPSPVLKDTSVMVPAGVSLDDWMLFPYFVIEPLEPVTPGHLLVIPREHSPDFRTHPRLLGAIMLAAAMVAADGLADAIVEGSSLGHNLIVSAGVEATQTVPHMHVHVVPRREGDGLLLPWSAPDVRAGLASAIDLLDARGMPDVVMKPIRAAYRQVTRLPFGERRGEPGV